MYSRIGQPYAGTASYFSFNDPNGMCPECSGIGKVMTVDIESRIDPEKTWNEGMADLPAFHVGNWYWKQYAESGLFPLDKKWKDFTKQERNRLLYGADTPDGKRLSKKVDGVSHYLHRMLIHRDTSTLKEASVKRLMYLVEEKPCPLCRGRRLNAKSLACKVEGYSIDEMCAMEFTELVQVLRKICDPRVRTVVDTLVASLERMIDIGLPYLSMDRESSTLSGGEAQRLKLVRYMGSALTGMIYIFDEPSTGMHPRDVYRMTRLLQSLRDRGNTVLVVEHDRDVILVDQSPVTATGRSTPATFLGFFDEIRKVMAKENGVEAGLFSFNSKGACPVCNGRGQIVTELVFMDPVTTVCEACEGKRYSEEAMSYQYKGKNIVEILDMSAGDAYEFFKENRKLKKALGAMLEVGLPYLSLGQPLSTLSGGERQRVKLAKDLYKKGNIYVLDEPTTGLHASDVKTVMELLDRLVDRGNTVIVIEHNLDVMKQADWLIDVGPDGGTAGGQIVFTGTPEEMVEHAHTITAEYLRKSL